jgi:hypothetical protein
MQAKSAKGSLLGYFADCAAWSVARCGLDYALDLTCKNGIGAVPVDGCEPTRNRKVELESLLRLMSANPASNSPATKPHIATASIMSHHGNLRAEQG